MSEGSFDDTMGTLRDRIPGCMGSDRPRLLRRLEGLERNPRGPALERLAADVAASAARRASRLEGLPAPSFPEDLPVARRRDEIARAIAAHPVVVVAGETGSGKTTQLPKICLALGRGVDGLIGHTQPRRIAARSLAERIAEELGTPLGRDVGCKVRFSDRTRPEGYVKVMTDGILLAETRGDRHLSAYDTLILDEAHERSLNIDFLLGYVKRILPRRPDLRVVITSATIDTERFARHFDAPVVEVSGRTYPVEVRYRPPEPAEGAADPHRGLLDAVDELAGLGPEGDILVFLPGEREIREAAEALRKHHPRDTEVLPLFARLSAAEQHRVFHPGPRRRIVLATNVAETSLTVPRIRYVIDSGLARISRYSTRAKVQRLPVEPVSRASADQRKGRCGRLSEGVCIRLYAEDDYDARPAFTEPEVRRTNLAAVILRMLALDLGDVAEFPFIDPPDRRQVTDGLALLAELGAVDGHGRITPTGRRLADYNVDPRIARMVLAAREEGALREVLVIAAALSIRDPRERPVEAQARADAAHARFRDPASDFRALLNLWDFYDEAARHRSRTKLRALCKEHFLSYPRMREWRDLHRELSTQVREAGARVSAEPATDAQLHRALLAGLLGHVGHKVEPDRTGGRQRGAREYLGARQARFVIHPGSGLARKPPEWVVAAELVETGRLYGRICARVEPEWIEQAAGGRLKRTFFEPHWDRRRAAVMAFERTALYGLTLCPKRRVPFGLVDPGQAREVFLRQALVAGEFGTRAPFLAHNRRVIEEIESASARHRNRAAGVDEEAVLAFYDARVPPEVHDGRTFETWRKQAEEENPRRLFLSREDVARPDTPDAAGDLFPDHLEVGGLSLPLTYRFRLGHPEDGVTATLPLHALNTLAPGRFEWLVPGMLRDKAGFLLKSLPKRHRRDVMPWTRWAGAFAEEAVPGDTPLTEALAAFLKARCGTEIPPEAWDLAHLPDHLSMRFVVVDEQGAEVGAGRDLARLKDELGGAARAGFAALPKAEFERAGATDWDFGDLPESVSFGPPERPAHGHPALVDRGDAVDLVLLEDPEAARRATRDGLLRLAVLRLPRALGQPKQVPIPQAACLHYAPLGPCDALKADLHRAVLEWLFFEGAGEVRTRAAFEARVDHVQAKLGPALAEAARAVTDALARHHALATTLAAPGLRGDPESLADLREHLGMLVFPGFAAETPHARLLHLPRHLTALSVRLERLQANPARDRKALAAVAPLWRAYRERVAALGSDAPDLAGFRDLLEELRVSLFAQEVGTAVPVSVPRLERAWKEIAG
jgi:ATP-dependent helicase HrpA